MGLTADEHGLRREGARDVDYRRWTIEELRALGVQLQLPDAQRKTRGELLEILDVGVSRRFEPYRGERGLSRTS